MQINSFSIRRYKGFDKEVTVPISQFTVLTGPNNLGKSTVLRALEVFFGVFERGRYSGRYSRISAGRYYKVEEDYPKRYEGRRGRRWPSRFGVTLSFSDEDKASADAATDLDLPDTLDLMLEMGLDERGVILPSVESKVMGQEDLRRFLPWFFQNFRYIYIPAARNIQDFRRSVFSELVEGAISSVGQSSKRVSALERFYNDVQEQLAGVENALAEELQTYLPNVRKVEFVMGELDLLRFISVRDVEVDDGAHTSLHQKGDGFKSLFAMSVLQFVAKQRYGKNLIFGIEEPESHLHATAIYELKGALRELSNSFQVLLTTHSPILIQRDDLRSNIVVEQVPGQDFSSTAKSAKTLAHIRRSLGIRPQDNMSTAEVVLVAEGATEETTLPSLLSVSDPALEEAFSTGRVRIISAGSAANVLSVVRALARDAASCIVLLDSDQEGDNAADKIAASGLLGSADLFQVPKRDGCLETEFEDLFDPEIYVDEVSETCGISLTAKEFESTRQKTGSRKTRAAKWSHVMKKIMEDRGKDWSRVNDSAKEATSRALSRKAADINDADLVWAKSIAKRIDQYLSEER